MSEFSVIKVPSDAASKTEAMGTKQKFWFYDRKLCICLFKLARLLQFILKLRELG